jgi:hypothetical protein
MTHDKVMALPDPLRAMAWAMDAFANRDASMKYARRWPESRGEFVKFARESNRNGVEMLKRAQRYYAEQAVRS